jgi:adenosine kinase
MARILICGSLAFDLIGRSDQPLGPATRNVKLDRLDEAFGGCAMNIAYTLARLGHEAVPLVYVGTDYEPVYATHVRKAGISEVGIVHDAAGPCARGIVLTGSDGQQITAFYPGNSGVARLAHDLRGLLERERFDAAILAPDLVRKTRIAAAALAAVPLRVWCPGQYAEFTDAATAVEVSTATNLVVVNRHEHRELFGPDPGTHPAARAARRIVVTDGPGPIEVLPEGLVLRVPPIPTDEWRDPTGCGDAFAAALTGSLADGRALAEAVNAGIEVAGRCLRHPGAQAH